MKNEYLDEKEIIELPYKRMNLKKGSVIPGLSKESYLKKHLKEADAIVIHLYWKPLGDSFLFLSVVKAAYDYLCIINREREVKFVIDEKFSDLLTKISFLGAAKIVPNGLSYFQDAFKRKRRVFLLTDLDPFWSNLKVPVFNSEEFKYPRFYALDKNSSKKVIYSSRPSRYYLTFERELGVVLDNPNKSLPFFVLSENMLINKKVKNSYNLDLEKENFITLINQTSKVEKKFGLIKFFEIAKYCLEKNLVDKILFLVNPHEESPEIWLEFTQKIKGYKDKIILYPYESDDFIELAYLLSRSQLVVGNDTGFSHLASMSKSSSKAKVTPVYIIYSKHDYTKWTTGYSKPISTKLADFLAENNLSVRREKINQRDWGEEAYAFSIPVDRVLKETKLLIKKE